MRIAAALLLWGTVAAGPCLAQTPGDTTRCSQMLAPLLPLLSPQPAPVLSASGPGSCTFKGARIEYGDHFAFAIGSLVLKEAPPAPVPPAPQSPLLQRRVELHDVIQIATGGNPDIDWLLQQQQVPVDIAADATEDRAAHRLTVNEISLHGDDVGQVVLSGVVEQTGPDDPADGLPDLSKAGVRSIRLQTNSRRFFVKYILPMLVSTWHGGDPAADMAETKLQAMDSARDAMALMRASPQSIEAVLAFLQDLPKPKHVLDLSITATAGPLTRDDADQASSSMMGLAAVLAPMRIKATYAGDAH